MKPVFIDFDYNNSESLYVQLYDHLKHDILSGDIVAGERLPSLRSLAKQIGVSITTCSRAYDQLLLEGYVDSRPQSGYYVNKIVPGAAIGAGVNGATSTAIGADATIMMATGGKYYSDTECFDFVKWKKCAVKVLNEKQEALLSPADSQGEYELRVEISKYLYRARGVAASPDQIVISAGVQQLTNHLARILKHIGIDFVNVEDPGYQPVQQIFRDRGFTINKVPVGHDGIEIDKLPVNLNTAVYVSPSNQFPTGSVMPVSERYKLLSWAKDNGSVIIEDDYDSELRYFGDPLPALKGLDTHESTVYLGSFSSTLFPAIRISYMVLPVGLASYFIGSKASYDQTCSKTEQLTLAAFMEQGFYQSGIRKLRKLYARKLSAVIAAFKKYGGDFIAVENTKSGINIRLRVSSDKPADELCNEAKTLRLHMIPLPGGGSAETQSGPAHSRLIFYYDQIPEKSISAAIEELCRLWASRVRPI